MTSKTPSCLGPDCDAWRGYRIGRRRTVILERVLIRFYFRTRRLAWSCRIGVFGRNEPFYGKTFDAYLSLDDGNFGVSVLLFIDSLLSFRFPLPGLPSIDNDKNLLGKEPRSQRVEGSSR